MSNKLEESVMTRFYPHRVRILSKRRRLKKDGYSNNYNYPIHFYKPFDKEYPRYAIVPYTIDNNNALNDDYIAFGTYIQKAKNQPYIEHSGFPKKLISQTHALFAMWNSVKNMII